jgi:hypothetical protein
MCYPYRIFSRVSPLPFPRAVENRCCSGVTSAMEMMEQFLEIHGEKVRIVNLPSGNLT